MKKNILLLFSFFIINIQFGFGNDSIAKKIYKLKTTVPVEYNQYVQEYISEYLSSSKTSDLIGMGNYYLPEIEKIMRKNKIPVDLKYLPFALSQFNPRMVNNEGASGCWQLKYNVAKSFGLKINSFIDERRDYLLASECAAKYLDELYNIYEDWQMAIAAYYATPLEINKAIRQSGGQLEYWKIHSYLSEEYQKIVPNYIATLFIFNYYKDFKIIPHAYRAPTIDTVAIKKWTTLEQVSNVLSLNLDDLKDLNPIFKKYVIPSAVKPYILKLPSGNKTRFLQLQDSIYIFENMEPSVVTIPERKPNINTSPVDTTQSSDTTSNEKEPIVEKPKPEKPKPEKPKPEKPKPEKPDPLKGKALLTYKVKKGDGLGKIADKYDCTVTEIKTWNKLKNNTIIPGQSLKIYVPKNKLSKYKNIK